MHPNKMIFQFKNIVIFSFRLRYLYLIILLFIFSGCAAKSPKVKSNIPSFATPSNYSSQLDESSSDKDWVSEITNDKILGELITEVQKNNIDIKKAVNNVGRAASSARITGSNKFPKFSGGLGGRRNQQAFLGFPFGRNDPQLSKSLYNAFGLSLDMQWEIDLWGRIKAGQEANIAEFEATLENLQGMQASLAGQTAKIWFAILGSRKQLALAESSLQSFKESQKLIQNAFDSGNAKASQVYLAASDVKVAESLLVERQAQTRSAVRQLEIMMGRSPSGQINMAGSLPSMPPPPPPGLPSELLLRRTDLRAAERRLAASEKRIKEAWLALLPQISLTGNAGTATESLRYVANSSAGVWSLAGRTGAQLFRGGEVLANLKIRKINQSDALLDYEQKFLEALKDVETCLDNEVVLKNRWLALIEAKKNSVDSYERASMEYKNGIGTSVNLLLTQRQMLSVSSQVLELERMRLENRVNLHLSLGGTVKKQ